MTCRSRILRFVPVLLLAACAAQQGGTSPAAGYRSCNSLGNKVDCKIPVKVERRETGCALEIAHGHELIRFKNVQNNRDRVIHWQLTGNSDYAFPQDGIRWVDDSRGNFKDPMRSPDNREIQWTNQNRESSEHRPASYKYDIVVERIGNPSVTCNLDPFIRNLR
jgi:hypothetical protein